MKNKILALGTVATISSSALVVLACGDNSKKTDAVLLSDEIAKFQDFDSVDLASAEKTKFSGKAANADVKTQFEALREYKAKKYNQYTPLSEALASGVTLKEVKVKTAYSSETHKVVLLIKVSHNGNDSEAKEITIRLGTTNVQTEVNKLQDISFDKSAATVVSDYNFATQPQNTDLKSQLTKVARLYSGSQFTNGVKTFLKDALASGISIASVTVKTPYDKNTAELIVTIELAKTSQITKKGTNAKDVTITFGGEDLTSEVAKLKTSFTTTSALPSGLDSKKQNADAKSDYMSLNDYLVNQNEKLTAGVSIAKVVVKTVYKVSSRSIVFTITLAKEGNTNGYKYGSNTKDVTVIFPEPAS